MSPREAVNRIPLELLEGVRTVVTHEGCPDGIASAMILQDALRRDVAIRFVQYGTAEHRDLEAVPGMLFCDMTPPAERASDFVAAGGVVVLDHHRGARATVEAFGVRGVFADEVEHPGVSGALLAFWVWERLTRRYADEVASVEHLAQLAGIRDTWQRHDELWRDACAQAEALRFYGAERLLRTREPSLSTTQIGTGYVILERREREAAELARRAPIVDVAGLRVAVVNTKDTSDVGEALRAAGAACDLLAGFEFVPPEAAGERLQLVWSLRSVGAGVDVQAIARAGGGNGHTRAAGFSVRCESFCDPLPALRAAIEARAL